MSDNLLILGGAAIAGYLGAKASGDATGKETQKRTESYMSQVQATIEDNIAYIESKIDNLEGRFADYTSANEAVVCTDMCAILSRYRYAPYIDFRIWVKLENKTGVNVTFVATHAGIFYSGMDVASIPNPAKAFALAPKESRWCYLAGENDYHSAYAKRTKTAIKDTYGSVDASFGKTLQVSLSMSGYAYPTGGAVKLGESWYPTKGKMLLLKTIGKSDNGRKELEQAGLIYE